MPPAPLVSVIIPVYNAEKFIAATLDSVKKQTYQNWECIVIDDGSTDNSKQVIDNFIKKDNRFRYLLGQHGGVSRARNMGIADARGEFIALLDHDDLWVPTKLNKQVAILFQRPEVGLVYSDAFIRSSKKTKLHSSEVKLYRGKVFHRLVRRDFITCQTAIIRKKLLSERRTAFIPELEMAEEFELFLWIAARSEIDFIDEPLATYIVHGGNDSLKRYEIILDELLVIHEKLKNDPVIKSLSGSKKALLSLLRLRDREEVLMKWQRGQSVTKDLFRFYRGCCLRYDWRFLIAMRFISFKTFKHIGAKLRQFSMYLPPFLRSSPFPKVN